MNLTEVKAIVTGGASGMGRAFAVELARAGAQVVVADLDEAKMAEVVAAGEGRIHALRANVAEEQDVIDLIEKSHAAMGGLNVLVNNAGIFRDGLLVKPEKDGGGVRKMSLKDWNQVLAVDLTGPFLCTREFAAKMISTGTKSSCVVNISSIARHGNAGQSNYSAAKAGLVADTKLWGLELARYGIRTGAIAPGFTRTPILDGMPPEALEKMKQPIPLKRIGEPDEMYMAVKFIFENDFFTCRTIEVDGGQVL